MNIALKHIGYPFGKIYLTLAFLIGIACVGGVIVFPLGYLSGSNLLLGICLFPFALSLYEKPRFNVIYFCTIVMLGWLSYRFELKVFYFMTIVFYILFLIEWTIGRVNPLILFLVTAMSPVFEQVSSILGFPIRLWLSHCAGEVLRLAGMHIESEGNMIVLNNANFTVDDACMGLNMLAISFLMGIFVVAHHTKTTRQKISFRYLAVFFLAVITLNIISNLLRIITLVIFKILPGDPLHDVIGLLCFACYVLIPLYFLGREIIDRFGKKITFEPCTVGLSKAKHQFFLCLSVVIAVIGFTINPDRSHASIPYATVTITGMQATRLDGGITKLTGNDVLIYIKPIPEFFTGEHTPLLCWKGSGYKFKKIEKKVVAGHEVYLGLLQKKQRLLYTAWWYSDGKIQTIEQAVWRLRMLQGKERFCLINVTTKNEKDLFVKLQTLLEKDPLAITKSL